MTQQGKPGRATLAVMYDRGSVGPARIARAAPDNDCDVVFVATDSGHSRDMIPVLSSYGKVVDAAGLSGAELAATLAELRLQGIVTFSEFQLGPTAELAAELGLTYHALADIPAITRKDEQRRRLAAAGIDEVRFATITHVDQIQDAVRHVGLPAIVKPVVGASSRHTVSVTTAAQCQATVSEFLAAEQTLMLEELLVGRPTPQPWGDYIAVDCVALGGDVAPLFVTSKFALAQPYRERGGYGSRSVVDDDEVKQVRELACRAVRALNIRDGVADVEIKLTADGPRVIEVNGRLGGWVDDLALRSRSADPVDVAVRAALGRDIDLSTEPDGPIAFHYLIVPPAGASTVRAIHDRSPLLRLPHVDRVAVMARPGASADWRIGAPTAVAAVLGTTEDHEQLAHAVTAIESVDWIDFD